MEIVDLARVSIHFSKVPMKGYYRTFRKTLDTLDSLTIRSLHTPEQDINNTLILAPDHTPERAEFSTPLSSPVQALDLSNTQYKASLVGQDGLLSEMKSHQAVTGGNLGSND